MAFRSRFKFDFFVGLVVPLAIFLDPRSPIILATSSLAHGGVAFPLSFLVLPAALAVGIYRLGRGGISKAYGPLLALAAPFVIYALTMSSVFAVSEDPRSFLYGVQWALMFLWIPYFLSLKGDDQFLSFYEGFSKGAIFTVAYYFASGVLEIVFYGALMDMGRMTQNLIFPGQYQIAVYVPTLIACSAAFVNGLFLSNKIDRSKLWVFIFNALAVFSLFFLAAREAMLVYLLSMVLFYTVKRPSRFLISACAAFIFSVLFFVNSESVFSAMQNSKFRAFQKIATLQYQDNRFAGRDVMIKDVLVVVERDPIFGSHFLPPDVAAADVGTSAPSAHNMYVDAFIWAGAWGGTLFLIFCVGLLFYSLRVIWMSYNKAVFLDEAVYASVLVIIVLLVSNNLNVPMRQPLVAPLLAILFVNLFRRRVG